MKQAEENGFDNVLIKPVTSSVLFDRAVMVLDSDREATESVRAEQSFDVQGLMGCRVLLVEDN